MDDPSARLGPIVSLLATAFLAIAIMGFVATPPEAIAAGVPVGERADSFLRQGVIPSLRLALLAQVVFSLFLLLTVVALYRDLRDQSIAAMFFVTAGVMLAASLAVETIVIHLGAELELIRMFQESPVNVQGELVNIERVVGAAHDNAVLLIYAFGFIAFPSAGYLTGRNPRYGRFPSWTSYATGFFSALALIAGTALGVTSQIAVAVILPLMLALGVWCFSVGRAQARSPLPQR